MSIRCACRSAIVLAALMWSSPALAQSGVDITAGALLSLQPKGYDGTGGPYLDESLGGRAIGFSAGLDLASPSGAMLTIELSSTLALEQVQSGRFVAGLGPALARHRDTLVSLLPGFRARWANGAQIEPKGGISVLFGTPTREPANYDDPAGKVAITVGLDVVLPVSRRIALVPAVRYSHAYRGNNAFYFGLGDEILRVGMALRFPSVGR